MATLESRLAALEQTQRKARRQLVILISDKPTPEQAAQIEQAEREGRPVLTITLVAPRMTSD